MQNSKRLLVADDHQILRDGLRQLFELAGDIYIGAEASSGNEVLEYLKQENFDLLLLDINMPNLHGEELIDKIRKTHPNLPILILSMHNEVRIARSMLRAGASGFITKANSSAELLEAIRKVAAGGRFIASEIAEDIFFTTTVSQNMALHEFLSARELLILRMLASGKSVNQIAQTLKISNKTVSTHKTNLMGKMYLKNFASLMRYAIEHGLSE